MSGKVNSPARPLIPAEQASQLLDQVVHERVRELIDFCCLYDFELELRRALVDCGLPCDGSRTIAADMIARALVRIGDDHKKVVADVAAMARNANPPD